MGRVVTIDGPAGVGKSTAARELSNRLGWLYLDSGSLYRATAWVAMKMGLDTGTPQGRHQAVLMLAEAIHFERTDDGVTRLLVGDEEPGGELRTDTMARGASEVARDRNVRISLLPVQQGVGLAGNVVAEGRDMGTVVFPLADVKFFLIADAEVRAQRRVVEFESRGQTVSIDEVLDEMTQRDTRDRTREVSPLVPAEDAVIVDTGHLGIEEVVDVLFAHVRERISQIGR